MTMTATCIGEERILENTMVRGDEKKKKKKKSKWHRKCVMMKATGNLLFVAYSRRRNVFKIVTKET